MYSRNPGHTGQTVTSETHMSHQGLAGRFGHGKGTYSADFQKCPGWESRRFSLGSFSSMSISWMKLGLSCRSKAQQADRISCGQRRVSGWELAEREEGTLQPLHRVPSVLSRTPQVAEHPADPETTPTAGGAERRLNLEELSCSRSP